MEGQPNNSHTLKERSQERYDGRPDDGHDATPDPIENRIQVIATLLTTDNISVWGKPAYRHLRREGPKEHH